MVHKDNDRLEKIFKYIDANACDFIQRLRQTVEIRSVSASAEYRKQTIEMVHWMKKALEDKSATCELYDVGSQKISDSESIPLPPIIFGHLGNDRKKKTICIYGHLDVQPALKEDGWHTDPFKLIEKDGKLFGRGSTDDKGPVVAWLNAIEAYQTTNTEIPVNLKFCFEAMEESGSVGLEAALKEKNEWLKDVDYVCISDNYWLGKKKPCLTYGLRGLCYFSIEITCASQDLHSGIHGGVVPEAMSDLVYLLDRLVDRNGNILVPKICDNVAPLTDKERRLYDALDFSTAEYTREIGAHGLHFKDKAGVLMHRWRYPSLSIHGIEGAFSEPGEKTVIPCRVKGKFSIRLVPNQHPDDVQTTVKQYIENLHKERGSPNPCTIHCEHTGQPWVSDFNHPHFEAGRRATKKVYGVEPDMTREGGSIPVTLAFQEQTNKNVMLIPLGSCDDMAHSQNEKIDVRNYIEGTKLLAAYLMEVAALE